MSNKLLNAMKKTGSLGTTTNGATTYTTTLNAVLDFFSTGASLRSRSEKEIQTLFIKAVNEDPLLAMKALFNVRNIRGGAGERNTFRVILKYLADHYPALVQANMDNIAYYGRFDDILGLFDTAVAEEALNYYKWQLHNDWLAYKKGEPISLAAKWAPSINGKSKTTIQRAKLLANYMGMTPRTYRKSLSALRAYSNVLEVTISAGEWKSIDYSKVPSKASLQYRKAFKRNDEVGYTNFLSKVEKGEVKINAGTLFPYELVAKVRAGEQNATIEALWDALPNYMEDLERNILVMADVSGSMNTFGQLPMNVSLSLAIYTAERNKGPFGGHFITYSANPVLHKVVGKTITEKIRCLARTEAYTTDLQRAFKMVLDHAVAFNVAQSDMPEQIIVVTDCEFNATQNGQTNLSAIKGQYRKAGYEMPQLVFWNVNSVQPNVPAQADEQGVLLVSGASPSVFKTLLSGKQFTPVDQMLATLNSPLYDRVKV